MNTEITDNKKLNGWIFYDATCPFCLRLARRFHPSLTRRRFTLLPLQTPGVSTRLGLTEAKLLNEMRLLQPDGKIFGGVDALLEISRHYFFARPFQPLANIPAVTRLLHRAYRWVARHRHCVGGACSLPVHPPRRWMDFLPLLILPVLALFFEGRLPAWIFMWTMAVALFAGCKWLTYRDAIRHGCAPAQGRRLGYLLAWPGMDAAAFFSPNKSRQPHVGEWIFASAKMLFGIVLLYGITPRFLPDYPELAGWTGMVGISFLLHFGWFHLLALGWQRAGINVTPLMQNPLGAESLADFWGHRWNTAFNELAFRFTYRPLRRFLPAAGAMLLVFALSGLIHECVISLPARAGYGLPTAYFLIQGLASCWNVRFWAKRWAWAGAWPENASPSL